MKNFCLISSFLVLIAGCPFLFLLIEEPEPQPPSENINYAPIAVAGPDQSVASGTTVIMSAIDSEDPDGDYFTFEWRQTAGPPVGPLYGGSLWNFSSIVRFQAPEVDKKTVLGFRLTVSDGMLLSRDFIVIEVKPAGE